MHISNPGSGPSWNPAIRVYLSRRPWKAAGGYSRSLQGSAFGDMVCRATDVSLSGFHFTYFYPTSFKKVL